MTTIPPQRISTNRVLSTNLVFGLPAEHPLITQYIEDNAVLILGDINIQRSSFQLLAVSRVFCTLVPRSPTDQLDAVAVIDRLVSLDFRGQLVVFTPTLLRPRQIQRELSLFAPAIDIRVIDGVLDW